MSKIFKKTLFWLEIIFKTIISIFKRNKQIKQEKSNKNKRLSWDQYFIKIAETISIRSLDQDTHVGCVIVDQRNRVVSTGYNSNPAGIDDNFWPTTKEMKEISPKLFINKYHIFVHAEANAIAASNGSLIDCTLYCTLHPCHECAKLIATAGIKKVCYRDYRDDDTSKIARLILKQANINLVQIKDI